MSYKVDPNDNTKMIPKVRSAEAYGYASTPAEEIFTKRPSHVLVNVNGTYAFSYKQTGSLGGTHSDVGAYTTGSILGNAAGGPVQLDIQPTAWRQTDASGGVGDITFVYRGD